jgi:hypothetical protein
MEKKEQKNPGAEAKQMLKRLQENSESLHISRIPPNVKKEFIEWADKEFCGDYGMALKWLWDDLPKGDLNTILDAIQNHEERILVLEETQASPVPTAEEPAKKVIKTLDGKKHEVASK